MNYLTFLSGIICLVLSIGLILIVRRILSKLGFTKEALVFTIITGLWFVLTSALGYSGILSDFSGIPPKPLFILFPTMITVLITSFLPVTQRILEHIPQGTLVGLQSFRIPVEIFLWMLFIAGEIPVQMSFEGRNWDILSGIFGALLYFMLRAQKLPRWSLFIYNLMGIGLLVNIVVTAILSMPTEFGFS